MMKEMELPTLFSGSKNWSGYAEVDEDRDDMDDSDLGIEDDEFTEEGQSLVSGDRRILNMQSLDDELDFDEDEVDWRWAAFIAVVFVLITSLAVIVPITKKLNRRSDETSYVNHFVEFSCPAKPPGKAQNYDNTSVESGYRASSELIQDNLTDFLATFRERDFDGWSKPYKTVKSGMYHWKSTRYPKNLKDGDSIFESACGVGLNLVMTLEIIQEIIGFRNLIIYGNEYILESADAANSILGSLAPQLNATMGRICPGDSTNLAFVPSDSFDLVFTGYISTLLDPLNFNIGVQENYKYYEEMCLEQDWKTEKLNELAQKDQNEWYGLWVSEMVRIAKPGAAIIIEQVSYPFCDAKFDWGGVDQQFWFDGIDKYGWDIDPSSIDMEDDRIFRKRYHVFMRKNPGEVKI